jgi:hypothetical protein
LITGRRSTTTGFFQWGRKEEGALNKPWIASQQPRPQRRRFQSSKSIFVRQIPKCIVSCDEQRTPFLPMKLVFKPDTCMSPTNCRLVRHLASKQARD